MSRIIRHDQANNSQVFEFSSLEKLSRKIVAAAQAKAREIVTEASNEVAQIRQTGVDEGREEGREEGLAQGRKRGRDEAKAECLIEFRQEASELTELLTRMAQDMETERGEMVDRAYREVLELAILVAQKVVGIEVGIGPDASLGNLRRAIELILDKTRLRVRVNPADRSAVEEYAPQVMEEYANNESVDVIADESISRGGVVVEGVEGEVDLTIESQMAKIEEEILGRRVGKAEES